MAEWVYERWTLKWPDTSGTPWGFATTDTVRVLSYDGTLQDRKQYTLIAVGDVFYWSSVMGNPTGYYQKASYATATYLGTDPPLPIKDTLIDVMVAEEGTYPDDGIHTDGYWYVKAKPAVKWIYERWQPAWPEATGGSSSIPRINGFPLNFDGTEGDRVLVSNMPVGQVFQYQESYYMKVDSNQRVEYPDGKPTAIKDTLIDTIVAVEGTVPDDGVYSDQLYYVKVRPVFPTMRILRNGQWIEAESGFVLKDGAWKPIEDVFVLKNGQWKNLQ